MITFYVHGKPEPAGSKRAFVNPKTGKAIVTDANAKSKPWKQEVAQTARLALPEGFTPLDGPVRLVVDFYVARPKGHYGTGKNAGTLREGAPDYPTTKPDATKLLRGLEDALTGIVWRDDSQIVSQTVRKRYGTPGALVKAWGYVE